MKKITLVAGLALILVVPTVAGAKPTQDKASKHAAKVACRSLRGHVSATREAFRTQYRSFAACVRAQRADLQTKQEITEFKNAAKECASERDADAAAFADQYGTNANKKNAFGKCVSQKARENHQQDESENETETETPPAS
jgi:hypothetical protein